MAAHHPAHRQRQHAKESRQLARRRRHPLPWQDAAQTIRLRDVLRVVQRGAIDSAHRIKQLCGQVLRFGVAMDLGERDVTVDLKGALTPVPRTHYPALTELGEAGGDPGAAGAARNRRRMRMPRQSTAAAGRADPARDRSLETVHGKMTAMGCAQFIVRLAQAREGKEETRQWSGLELLRSLAWLKRMSARGWQSAAMMEVQHGRFQA